MRKLIAICAAAGAFAAASAGAQVGHPAKGSWLGFYGPDADDQNRMLVVLDWKNREIVGTINPGRNGAKINHASIDYDTWTMTIEADMPVAGGGTEPFKAVGKIENLGSWVNRRYSGNYTLGDQSGTFRLTLN